jgi:hypothetical protein
MKLGTWNCCSGPLDKKLVAAQKIAADILVIPECPKLSKTSSHELWFGDNPRKGLAVIAGSDFVLERLELDIELPLYVIPIQVRAPVPFLLLAVWAKNEGADQYVRGVNRAVSLCEELIQSQPTVILGDFNSNTIWDSSHPKNQNHSSLVSRLNSLGLESSYHTHFSEQQGQESRPTFFMYRHETKPYHIDYGFIPAKWCAVLRSVKVGTFDEWGEISDHMPLTLEIEVGAI